MTFIMEFPMPGYQQPFSNQQQQDQNQNTPGRTGGQDTPKPHQGQNNMDRGTESDEKHESLLDLEPQERPRATSMPGREQGGDKGGANRDPHNRVDPQPDDQNQTNQSSQGQPQDPSESQRQGGEKPR